MLAMQDWLLAMQDWLLAMQDWLLAMQDELCAIRVFLYRKQRGWSLKVIYSIQSLRASDCVALYLHPCMTA